MGVALVPAASWSCCGCYRGCRSFRAAHPGIELRLSFSRDLVDLSRDGADVAIRFGRAVPQGPDELRPARTTPLICMPEFPADKLRRYTTVGITRAPWVLRIDLGELAKDGRKIRLQDQPLQILDELLSRTV